MASSLSLPAVGSAGTYLGPFKTADIGGKANLVAQLIYSGTGSVSVTVEDSADGGAWSTAADNATQSNLSASTTFQCDSVRTWARIHVTAMSSGSVSAIVSTTDTPRAGASSTVTVGPGSALMGQVEVSDGTNVLGTSTHPVRVDPTNATLTEVDLRDIGGSAISTSNPLPVQGTAQATGGWTKSTNANVNATKVAVKASAGTFAGISISNTSGATCFVQVFDATTGNVTPGTTVPDFEFQVATASSANFAITAPGANMANAITIISTTTSGGAVGSGNGVRASVQYA